MGINRKLRLNREAGSVTISYPLDFETALRILSATFEQIIFRVGRNGWILVGFMIRTLKHYISHWSLLLLFLEVVFACLSVYAGVAVRFVEIGQPDEIHGDVLLPRALFFAFVMVISMAATGRYRRLMDEGFSGEMLSVGLSFIIGLVAMSLLFYVFPDLFMGRGAFAYVLFFALVSFLLLRWLFFRYVLDLDLLKRRLLIFGTGGYAKQVAEVARDESSGFRFMGYWPVPGEPERVPPGRIVSSMEELWQWCDQHLIDQIVIALDEPFPQLLMDDLMMCKSRGIRVLDLLDFFEQEHHVINMDVLTAQRWILDSNGLDRGLAENLVKRVFDLIVSLVLTLVSLPLMALTAIAILIESGGRGPVFYLQERMGLDGGVFRVMKFRSMRTDAEKDGVARWAQQNDDRITRVGRFIRKSRIDELPQFFNVLRGEMSLVGPRPERPAFVEILQKKIPYYAERFRVKPGITGWAQVRYGYGASERDAAEKLKYDLYYAKNKSLFLDLLVLILSVEVVMFGQSATGPRGRKRSKTE